MAMEIALPKPEELFRAAENGYVKLLASLSAETLGWARSLRNEDGRSLQHVAASSGRSEVSSPFQLAKISWLWIVFPLIGFDNSEEFWGYCWNRLWMWCRLRIHGPLELIVRIKKVGRPFTPLRVLGTLRLWRFCSVEVSSDWLWSSIDNIILVYFSFGNGYCVVDCF